MTMMMMMIMVMMMMMMVVMMIMMMAGRAPSGKYLRCSVVAVLVLLHFVLASKLITLINTFQFALFKSFSRKISATTAPFSNNFVPFVP